MLRSSPWLLGVLLLLAPGCRSKPKDPEAEKPIAGKVVPAAPTRPPPPPQVLPIEPVHGGRIAKDDPAWAAADGYRRTPAEYGQPDWDHVRLVAVTHLAITGRDLARLDASRGAYKACAQAYEAAAARIGAVPLAGEAVTPVRDVLVAGLRRDAALCAGLDSRSVPAPEGTGLAAFRRRYLALALRVEKGADGREEARTMAAEVDAAARSLGAAPDAGASPADKALWLVRAWDDTVDPLVVSDPFGAWTIAERERQAAALAAALEAIGGGETKALAVRVAASLEPPRASWTGAEFSAVPLLDPWIDVGGFAAPFVVPQPEYGDAAAWVEQGERLARRWDSMREGEVPRAVRAEVAKLVERPEGERYFQALGLQNGAIRQLAREGHYFEALLVLSEQAPPAGLDWFGPDRPAALMGLEGRLRLLSGDREARKKLEAALAESESFLAFVAMREELDAAEAKAAPKQP